jgi:Flp pilus assembly protein CpaB
VTPDDAQRVALAQTEGHIQLALRNPLDIKQDDVAPSVSRGLYGKVTPVAAPVAHTAPRKITPVRTPPPAPAPTGVSVEVYQGDKKVDIVKCSDDGCEAK